MVAWVALLLTLLTPMAWAQVDPPGRVGRLAEVQGQVSRFDEDLGRWVEAERNRPVAAGDRLATGAESRLELRVGSTVLRLGSRSEIEVMALDDARLQFQLQAGSLALRVRTREVAAEVEVVTPEVRLRPLRAGHFRIDRDDDTTYGSSWRGELKVQDVGDIEGLSIAAGQRAEIYRLGQLRILRQGWVKPVDDEFAAWVIRDSDRDERLAAAQYVSPEMTGAEDLQRHGAWERHPEYGMVWLPWEVGADWAPYRQGRWVWTHSWGWTWVDNAAWGFAPFHYGRWVQWGTRWAWWPGEYQARPVFAPALVAWVGGPPVGFSIGVRGPGVHWVPLAPRQAYVPHPVGPFGHVGQPGRGATDQGRWADTRPMARPDGGRDHRPDGRPDDRPGHRPDYRPDNRPENRPGSHPDNRPGDRPGDRAGGRVDNRPAPRTETPRPIAVPQRPGPGNIEQVTVNPVLQAPAPQATSEPDLRRGRRTQDERSWRHREPPPPAAVHGAAPAAPGTPAPAAAVSATPTSTPAPAARPAPGARPSPAPRDAREPRDAPRSDDERRRAPAGRDREASR